MKKKQQTDLAQQQHLKREEGRGLVLGRKKGLVFSFLKGERR